MTAPRRAPAAEAQQDAAGAVLEHDLSQQWIVRLQAERVGPRVETMTRSIFFPSPRRTSLELQQHDVVNARRQRSVLGEVTFVQHAAGGLCGSRPSAHTERGEE